MPPRHHRILYPLLVSKRDAKEQGISTCSSPNYPPFFSADGHNEWSGTAITCHVKGVPSRVRDLPKGDYAPCADVPLRKPGTHRGGACASAMAENEQFGVEFMTVAHATRSDYRTSSPSWCVARRERAPRGILGLKTRHRSSYSITGWGDGE